MKELKTLFAILISIGLSSCGGDLSKDGQNSASENPTSETQRLNTEAVNIGKVKMNADGHSEGEKTELTELYRLIQLKEADFVEINWIWDTDPAFDDIPMKIEYDKLKGDLKLIYLKNNVREEYSNVFVDCLSLYLKNGEKGFHLLDGYCKDAKYDFNNREMTQ